MSHILASILRMLRREKKLTQSAMARAIQVPRVTYTHYELGRRTPDLDTLLRMAGYHQVSVDYLLGRTRLRPTLEQWLAARQQSMDAAPQAEPVGLYACEPADAALKIAESSQQEPF